MGGWARPMAAALLATAMLTRGVAAAEPESPPPKPKAAACARAASFRTVIDVGHTAGVPGALSARGVPEYVFNLHLATEIENALRTAGFDKTVLMVTAEAPTAGLFKRAARANDLKADLLLAIHHDAVPDSFLQTWLVAGEVQHYYDRFPGHSLFISQQNGDHAGSLAYAHLLGMALKARGLTYTPHYTEKYMGHRQRELMDADAGVYRYDQLIVLKETHMPAVLLEAGSIVNRDEELLLATPERQRLVAGAVVEAVDAFCAARSKARPGRAAALETQSAP